MKKTDKKPKEKSNDEIALILIEKQDVNLTGSMILYLLTTLKEKSMGLAIKNELMGEDPQKKIDEPNSVERANATVAAYIMMQAYEIFGEDYVIRFLKGEQQLPVQEFKEQHEARKHGLH